MIKLYRRFRQWRCWVNNGRDTDNCRWWATYERFAIGACRDCRYNPRREGAKE